MSPMDPLHHITPTWRSTTLSEVRGGSVLLKMENFQPVGSFKIRGIGAACQGAILRDGATKLVSSSGGNAGYAVAYAGQQMKVPVTVVVPRTTSEFMRAKIRAVGAEVLEHGDAWDDAHKKAIEIAEREGGALLHPFDNPRIWAGHASMIEEVQEQTDQKPEAVVVAVGGGGLLCGVLEGLHRVGWTDVPVVAAETEGAASLRANLNSRSVSAVKIRHASKVDLGQHPPLGKGELEDRIVGHLLPVDQILDDVLVDPERQHRGDDLHLEPPLGGQLAKLGDLVELVLGEDPEAPRRSSRGQEGVSVGAAQWAMSPKRERWRALGGGVAWSGPRSQAAQESSGPGVKQSRSTESR